MKRSNIDQTRARMALSILAGLLIVLWGPADSVEVGDSLTIYGYLDARAALANSDRSWLERGLGKTRYGEEDGLHTTTSLDIAEAGLVAKWRPHEAWLLGMQVAAAPDYPDNVDLIETFAKWEPTSSGPMHGRVKAGLFFPALSQENTEPGWLPRWTITPSAINNWIGEELRIIGIDGTLIAGMGDGRLEGGATVFAVNDPAGSILAWRGWSSSDYRTGLFGALPLPKLPALAPDAPFNDQNPDVEPYREIDGRPGLALHTAWRQPRFKISAALYDSFGDLNELKDGQYAWRTQFFNIGTTWQASDAWTLLAQGMVGRTRMGPGAVVDVPFASAFVLLGHQIGKHRIAGRIEFFAANDRDEMPIDPNKERGGAATLAWGWEINKHLTLRTEGLVVTSDRPARKLQGTDERVTEGVLQISALASF